MLTCVYHIYLISVNWYWNLSSCVIVNCHWAVSKPDIQICPPCRFGEGRGEGCAFCDCTCHNKYIDWMLLLCRRIKDLNIIEGGDGSYAPPPTPKPITTICTGRAGKTFKHQGSGQATRGSMALFGSQSEGCILQTDGRRATTGTAGGGHQTKQQTDGDEAIGGEI